jgi:hypothetical protein
MGTAGDVQSRNRLMNSEVVSKVMTAARSPCVRTHRNQAHSSAELCPDSTPDSDHFRIKADVNSSALVEQLAGAAFIFYRRRK